jgi:copper chaperone CopZ
VGKAALDGLPGVESVTSGFSGGKEINTVTYDPHEITVAVMVEALKNAGTYLGTAGE